jgi:SIR2-like domain
MTSLEPPYGGIWDLLKQGRIVPFLGAGASLSERGQEKWDEDLLNCLPSATELGQLLARKATFPDWQPTDDLAKVAQYYRVVMGRDNLRQQLRQIFAGDYPYASIHDFLAGVPAPLLIVTTNYDDLIERAFRAKGRPFDLVIHPTDNKEWGGAALYWKHGAAEPEFPRPNKLHIDLSQTTVIYKMHGAVDRQDDRRDSYVIDEEDYVDFLVRIGSKTAIPAMFAEPFSTRHFLFLGYGLRDWNLRVILSKIEKDLLRSKTDRRPSWAIQEAPSLLEQELWRRRQVTIYDMKIQDFIRRLRREQAEDT